MVNQKNRDLGISKRLSLTPSGSRPKRRCESSSKTVLSSPGQRASLFDQAGRPAQAFGIAPPPRLTTSLAAKRLSAPACQLELADAGKVASICLLAPTPGKCK